MPEVAFTYPCRIRHHFQLFLIISKFIRIVHTVVLVESFFSEGRRSIFDFDLAINPFAFDFCRLQQIDSRRNQSRRTEGNK